MRIGINTLFLVPGDVGGTEVYLRENLKEMVPGNPGDTFVFFTSRDNDESLRRDLGHYSNVEFVALSFRSAIRPMRIIAEQTLLPWKTRKQNLDVLWSPGYTAPIFYSGPQAVTIHDLQYKTYPEDLSFLERITLDFLVKKACKVCDSIIAVSEFSKSEIVRFNFAPAGKIHVAYEGVNNVFAESSEVDIAPLTGIPADIPYLLCVAHTYPHKQVHLLVQAFEKMVESIPHHLVLVGKPRRGEAQVQKSLNNLPDGHRVHRINNLNEEELRALYQKADLFILPSEYEGFGLPVLEALLAGVVVITTAQASLPEVGGSSAVYSDVDSPDRLAEVIGETLCWDVQKRDRRITEGKAWARSFTWKKSAEQTIKIIRSEAASI